MGSGARALTPSATQTQYESAVERTLQGVRSRSSFASSTSPAAKAKGRGGKEGPTRREPSNSSPLLTAADEVELAKKIQVRLRLGANDSVCTSAHPSCNSAGLAVAGAHAVIARVQAAQSADAP